MPAIVPGLGPEREVTRVARIEDFYSDCPLVLLPALSIIISFSHLSCLAPLERRGRVRERESENRPRGRQHKSPGCRPRYKPPVPYPVAHLQVVYTRKAPKGDSAAAVGTSHSHLPVPLD